MNLFVGIGRLTADPVINTTPSGISCARFTLAIDRKFKDKDGNRQADFLACIAWRAQADFVDKYFKKGDPCVVTGTIQNRSYEVDGQKRYITEVITDSVEFVPKNSGEQREQPQGYQPKGATEKAKQSTIDDLQPIDDDSELPF